MTKHEKIVISAYTGYLLTDDFGEVHRYIEEKLGRPVFTHELANPEVLEEIRGAIKKDLRDILDAAT